MKKSITLLSLVSVVLILVLSGFVTNRQMQGQPSGDEVIPVDPFTAVSISISANVYLEQGTPQKLVIEADPSTLEKIEATVKDNHLEIKRKERGSRLKGDVTIHITVPELERVSLAGSGTIKAGKTFTSEEMTLRLAGSGIIEFDDLQSEELDAKISGSGQLVLGGQAKEFDLSLAGSGDVDAYDFVTAEFEGKLSGSGSCKVNVTGELGATIAGSGDIHYKGTPKVQSTVAGSGSVSPAD